MTMIKCPECRHHISSMAKACPECGAPIDPEWAAQEAEKELKKLEEVPFTVEENFPPENLPFTPSTEDEEINHIPTEGEGAHAASPRGGRVRFVLLFLLILLGVCVGGLYYYDYTQRQAREERAYALLQDCSNPAFYEDFIVRFPHSPHIDEVRERLKEVMAQQNEWEKLIASGNRQELQKFVTEHPTSPYVKMAQTRIDSLDWAEADQRRTLEAVTFYMATHPDGLYINQADALRQTLEQQRAAAQARADSLQNALGDTLQNV
ncbi:MAG: hypothetical protein IJ064_03580 [Bacteroidaceae bacterium]|nr:hypothetical protein [Bacteroidaceae bacterium]